MFAASVKKCLSFSSKQETYWGFAFLERLSFSFMALLTVFIVASNPFSDCKIIEILSIGMLLLSRSSSILSVEQNYRKTDANFDFEPGMVEVAAYAYFFFLALRYKKLLMKEPVSTSRTLIFNTLPKTIFSAIIFMAYMNSDSIECVLSNKDKLVTPTSGVVLCTDLDISTRPINCLVIAGAAFMLFVSPTDKNDYSMKSYVMFSFSFGHQILVNCVGLSVFIALYLYSTMRSGDELLSEETTTINDWFSDDRRLEGYIWRSNLGVLSSFLAFAPIAIVMNENARLPECMMAFARRIQRMLSTKKTSRFSNTHRYGWFVLQLLISFPIFLLWLNLKGGNQDERSVYYASLLYSVICLLQVFLFPVSFSCYHKCLEYFIYVGTIVVFIITRLTTLPPSRSRFSYSLFTTILPDWATFIHV